MIPESVVGEARRVAEATMTQECRVWRRAGRRLDTGEIVSGGEPAVVATHRCRLTEVKGKEAVIAGQVSGEVHGTLRLPVGAEVRSTDQLEVDGTMYEAVIQVPHNADLDAQVKVLVARA